MLTCVQAFCKLSSILAIKGVLIFSPMCVPVRENPLRLPKVKYISIYAFRFASISYTGTYVSLMLIGLIVFIFLNYSLLMY